MTTGHDHGWKFRPADDHGMAPMERLRSVKREPGLISVIGHGLANTCWWTYFKTYHRLKVEGAEKFPKKTPFVVVANHTSHFDAMILGIAMPRAIRRETFPISAGDVFFESTARSVLTSVFVNGLPLWRKKVSRHAMESLRERLAGGECGFILFPEGARSRDGKPMAYKPGIGMLTAGTPVPVVPCWIEGAFEALPPGAGMPRPAKITVRVGDPLDFSKEPNDRDGWQRAADAVKRSVLGMGSYASMLTGPP